MALKPAKQLLRHAVGLQLPQPEAGMDARELLQPDALQQWKLRSGLLNSDATDGDADKLRLLAAGQLPAEPVGSILFEQYQHSVSPQRQKLAELTNDAEARPLAIAVELEGAVIRGELDNIFPIGRVVSNPSKITHERKLQLWLEHLLMSSMGKNRSSHLLAKEKHTEFAPLSGELAISALQPWVEAWHALTEGPVLFDAETGYFANKGSGSKPPEQRLREAATDPWVRQLYGNEPEFDAAAASWAERLYAPYVENLGKDVGYGR